MELFFSIYNNLAPVPFYLFIVYWAIKNISFDTRIGVSTIS